MKPFTLFRNLSVRAKIICICMGVSCLSLLLAGIAFLSIDLHSMRNTLRNRLINQADILGQSAASALVFDDRDFAAKTLAGLAADTHILSAAIYSMDGNIFAQYTKITGTHIPPLSSLSTDSVFSASFVRVNRPALLKNSKVGTITLSSDLDEIAQRLRFSLFFFSIVLLAALGISFLLSWWAQPLIMRPVNALTLVARNVAQKGDYTHRVDQFGPDELGILAETFNTMLDRIELTTSQLSQSEQELQQHRRHLEELVSQRTADLEAANQELRDFAYIVSHDLKAPLRAISQLSTWISEDYGATLPAEGQQQLHLMQERVLRMHNLIDGILQYSRIGRVQEQRRNVDLNQVVADTIDILAPPPHIRVYQKGVLPVVFAEPVRMNQLFQNLISNAIKYMDKPQGDVVISAEKADTPFLCRISVTDNGPGIEEKYHQKIFQIFQTLAPSTSGTDSTGIGLALVKKIVELHGGTIEVNSTVGQGTQFSFTLTTKGAEYDA